MKGKSEKDGEKKLEKSYFDVMGMCCSSEVKLVERILQNLEGVNDVKVSLPTKTVVVQHDTLLLSDFQIVFIVPPLPKFSGSVPACVKALNQAKLEASVRVKGSTDHKNKWPSPYAIGSGVLLCLSFLKYFYRPFGWLALGAVAIGIVPIFFRAFMAIRNLALGDTNILVVIAVAGSIALNDYWEAGTIVFLFAIAEWLESRASHKATAAMSSLVNLVPQRAVLAETGQEVEVGEVEVNTLLAVKEGEIIPIDGIVTEGSCEIDERTLTGESFPVSKQKDSNVWAGTLNVNGYVVIQTMTLAEDSAVARMTKLVEEAQSSKSRTERYIEKCTKYYTPAIVVLSLCLVVVPVSLRLHNLRHWYHLALVILVSACPCALVLSTPVVMFCALVRAATSGVFFKGAQYLEILAKVRIIGFDKTGTITRGEFEVTEFQPLVDDISLSTMLYWVSSIERKSSHPLAAAVVDYAESLSVKPKPQNVEGFQNFPGEGIYGKIDGKGVYIGNKKIATRAGCKSVPKLEGKIGEGKSVGYIFLGARPAGIFCLSDICRTGAKEALKELKSMGIKTAMLTGDCQSAANHVQNQLGGFLEIIHAELLPVDKARIIKEFQEKSFTAMIGDGINDAPAIATADIGISMGVSGSALAIETGNIILMTNDIQKIPKVIHLARRVKRKMFENIFLSITTKGAIVGLAIAGHPLVWAAVLADVGTCLLVILNSMLLLGSVPRHITHSSSCSSHACGSSACSGSNDHGSACAKKPHHHHQSCCADKRPSNGCDSQGKKCCKSSATSGGIDQNSSCAEQGHHHQTCCNDKIPQNGGDSQGKKSCKSSACSQEIHKKNHCTEEPLHDQTCCNEKILLDGCDSQGKKCCKSSPCSQGYDEKIFSSEQPHHHQTCCNDKMPLSGCDSQMKKCHTSSDHCTEQPHHHQTCCDDSRAQNGCDAQACSSKDCSHAPQSNLSNCCSSETEKTNHCCVGKQNQHGKEENHIHDTKSLNHETCSIITQEPGLTSIKTEGKVDGVADTEDECSHHGSHKSGSQTDNCTSHSASIPQQILHERAEPKPSCIHPAKNNAHSRCGVHTADTTLGNTPSPHDHGSCGAIKSCGHRDKWHVGACCDSFRKECCAKGGHFHDNHRGGLSEIVIE